MITRKIKQLKVILILMSIHTRITSTVILTLYNHEFLQNPVDIISDELIYVEPVSTDNVKSCKRNGEIIITL